MVNCIDNSGAAIVECVNVLRRKSAASVGKRLASIRSLKEKKTHGIMGFDGNVSLTTWL